MDHKSKYRKYKYKYLALRNAMYGGGEEQALKDRFQEITVRIDALNLPEKKRRLLKLQRKISGQLRRIVRDEKMDPSSVDYDLKSSLEKQLRNINSTIDLLIRINNDRSELSTNLDRLLEEPEGVESVNRKLKELRFGVRLASGLEYSRYLELE